MSLAFPLFHPFELMLSLPSLFLTVEDIVSGHRLVSSASLL